VDAVLTLGQTLAHVENLQFQLALLRCLPTVTDTLPSVKAVSGLEVEHSSQRWAGVWVEIDRGPGLATS